MTKSKNISITIEVPREMFEEIRDILKDVLGYFAFAQAAESANPFKPKARKKSKEKAKKPAKTAGRPKGKQP